MKIEGSDTFLSDSTSSHVTTWPHLRIFAFLKFFRLQLIIFISLASSFFIRSNVRVDCSRCFPSLLLSLQFSYSFHFLPRLPLHEDHSSVARASHLSRGEIGRNDQFRLGTAILVHRFQVNSGYNTIIRMLLPLQLNEFARMTVVTMEM